VSALHALSVASDGSCGFFPWVRRGFVKLGTLK
jgi:hypothetical protein